MEKLKKKTLYLWIIVVVGIVMGILFANILAETDKKLVFDKVTSYFNNIKDDVPILYLHNLWNAIKNNLFFLILIWLLGLSIIGLLCNNFLLFFKSFILGFSIGSIIRIYLYQGIILSIVYVFPSLILNIIIYLIMTYYANLFSYHLFLFIIKKKEYAFNKFFVRYAKLFLFSSIILIISACLETFLNPFILKLFSFLIK